MGLPDSRGQLMYGGYGIDVFGQSVGGAGGLYRAENPISFWIGVALYCFLAWYFTPFVYGELT
jgi:hypothetical protein